MSVILQKHFSENDQILRPEDNFKRDISYMVNIIDDAVDDLGLKENKYCTFLMLLIAKCESDWTWTAQRLSNGKKGAARGIWQFEKIGIKGVLTHAKTKPIAKKLVSDLRKYRGLLPNAPSLQDNVNLIWAEIEYDDVLAAQFARLLLLTDPSPIPAYAYATKLYNYYIANWRPGKPIALKKFVVFANTILKDYIKIAE